MPVVLGAPFRNESGPCLVLQREQANFVGAFEKVLEFFMNGIFIDGLKGNEDLRRAEVLLSMRREFRKSCSRWAMTSHFPHLVSSSSLS